jgi:hypothetical protein
MNIDANTLSEILENQIWQHIERFILCDLMDLFERYKIVLPYANL